LPTLRNHVLLPFTAIILWGH